MIDDYAPNLKGLLEKYPEIEEALTFPDGHIYSFPQMTDPEFSSMRIGPKPFINKDWLETLDMDMPETTDEFYDYLKAVKEGDPNGNGENDEVPYGAPDIDTLYTYLRGSFNLANKGSENDNIDKDPETDEMRFYPISDDYKDLMKYMHKLYSEGLIAENIFTIDHTQYLSNSEEGKYGSVVWYDPNPEAEESDEEFVGMPALEGPDGTKTFSNFSSPLINIGAFVITKDNEQPAATIRWIDHFYGDEGMKEFFMGFEGETYELDDDGEPEYTDHILDSDDGLSQDQEIAKYLTFGGGGYPAMMTEKYFQGSEGSEKELEAAESLEPDLIEDSWPVFIHTEEEEDKLDGFGEDIEKYVEEMRDKFISGKASCDEWDDYVEELKSMNLDKFMDIKKAAHDRMKGD